ncbi:hypothetical protein TBR22_A51820 [Luteitalea sp. TBR-22]|uniref:DUF3293 domain-containing protein n=1 Tax=Luteitalea sp. TBR-22 TaxID=2802971 RepID=UPI001AF81D9C|nr:DUF3293 domain-containing protein [Luteitalea sp. TBR-22]BCS35947.1 hypothetical protein TBR22_A51820 [Luteitalea sp. TBR-22]
MDRHLLEAYRRAEYRVADRGYTFTLRIDALSWPLRAVHASFGVDRSAYITAWNPGSVPTDRAINEAAQASLTADVEALGLHWLRGEGVDPSGSWPGEPSLLVLGLREPEARALAARYGQVAILYASSDATPRLLVTGPLQA